MIIKTVIKASEMLAVALFVEKNWENQDFAGVNLEIKDGVMRIIACNRKNIVILKIDWDTSFCDINIVIPIELIKNVKKSNKQNDNPLTIEYNDESDLITFTQSKKSFEDKTLKIGLDRIYPEWGGVIPESFKLYPNWRRVIPESFEPGFNYYQLKQLSMFDEAATLLKGETMFYPNPNGAGVVQINLNDDRTFFGIVQQQFTDCRAISKMDMSNI